MSQTDPSVPKGPPEAQGDGITTALTHGRRLG